MKETKMKAILPTDPKSVLEVIIISDELVKDIMDGLKKAGYKPK